MADSLVHKMVKVIKIYEAGLCTHGSAESVIVNEVTKHIALRYIQDTYHRNDYVTSLDELISISDENL
jgi:hypothetical protein